MKLKWQYWYFKDALSHKFCDDIIKLADTKTKALGTISGVQGKKKRIKSKQKLLKHRNSKIAWLNEPWIYNELHQLVIKANKDAEWNFQFDYSENLQFTLYEKGQFYEWHQDSFDSVMYNKGDPNYNGKIRKLSVTVSLNDSSEYTGGRLQFMDRAGLKQKIITCEEIISKGSVVVFPSFMWHRVTPVKKGIRKSLVMWNLGYPFV
jgi:PKHD-type hydroxylase